MLKRITTATILVICLTAINANAQSANRFQIDIPFAFALKGRTLPAGKYVVERADPAKPNVLTLKNVEQRMVRLIITQRVEKDNPSAASSLVFIRRQGKFYLFQVWNRGAMDGAQIPRVVDKNNDDRRGQDFSLVTLRAKVE
jgi:hypothetical protein